MGSSVVWARRVCRVMACAASVVALAAPLVAQSATPAVLRSAPGAEPPAPPRTPVNYTVPDEGRGTVEAYGDHFVVVAGKTIRWNDATTYRLKAGRISVGMIAQWKGKRAGFTGDVLASQLTLSK